MAKGSICLAVAMLAAASAASPAFGQCSDLDVKFHNLRFFLDPALVGVMPMDELKSDMTKYAEEINAVFAKQTTRRFAFDPDTGITITSTKPQTDWAGALPEAGYELWVHAVLSDNPAYGTYGGYAGIDVSGAGVAAGLKWDAIHDPEALADGSRDLEQYWRQIDHVVHEFEHVFGAGQGEYYNLACVKAAPAAAPAAEIQKTPTDLFWGAREDYFGDPLLNNVYGLDLVGSPTSLEDLRNAVRFADVTVAVVDRGPRNASSQIATLPDLSAVLVQVLDGAAGLPIDGAAVRVWNAGSFPPYETEELDVAPTDQEGAFTFRWAPYPSVAVFGNYDQLKLIQVSAPGYEDQTTWVSIYDAVYERLIDGRDEMVVPIYMVPEPATLSVLALVAPLVLLRRRASRRCPAASRGPRRRSGHWRTPALLVQRDQETAEVGLLRREVEILPAQREGLAMMPVLTAPDQNSNAS